MSLFLQVRANLEGTIWKKSRSKSKSKLCLIWKKSSNVVVVVLLGRISSSSSKKCINVIV